MDYLDEVNQLKQRFDKAIADENEEHVAKAEYACKEWALNFVASIKSRQDIDEEAAVKCLTDLYEFVAERSAMCAQIRDDVASDLIAQQGKRKALSQYLKNSVIQHQR